MDKLVCACCGREFTNERDFLTGTSRFRVCEDRRLWFECSCRSCLVLEPNQFEWFDQSKSMSSEARNVFQQIEMTRELPLIPAAVAQLQAMILDENIDSIQLENALKSAPDISIRVLEMANILKAGGSEISSLAHAVTYVGRRTLGDLLLTISLQGISFETKVFDHHEFWRHSYLTAHLSEQLAIQLGIAEQKDQAFVAGTLFNIGKIIGALCEPERIDQILSATNDLSSLQTWSEAEEIYGKYSHELYGEVAAAIWGLPSYVTRCIIYHHMMPDQIPKPEIVGSFFDLQQNTDALNQDAVDLLPIVALSNQLAHWINLEPSRMQNDLMKSYAKVSNWSEEDLIRFVEKTKEKALKRVNHYLSLD